MKRYMFPVSILCTIVSCSAHNTSKNNDRIDEDRDAGSTNNDGGTETYDGGNESDAEIIDGSIDENDTAPSKPTCGDYPNYPDVSKCKLDETCVKHSDCLSDACNYKGKCIAEKSCTEEFGGYSCGAIGNFESCCTNDLLPTGVKLNRYKTTAGRIRRFVESVKGNVQGWYLENKNILPAESIAQIEPGVAFLPTDMRVGMYSVVAQLGGGIQYILDKPSSKIGCFTKYTGTHTYWLSPEDNAIYDDDAGGFTKNDLDQKPINCIIEPMAAAFCAWDGGRLQTFAENVLAFGPNKYPWGTKEPGGFGNSGGLWQIIGPADKGFKATACPTCDTTLINWSNNYEFPPRNDLFPSDYSYWISEPGRFPMDKGPYGTTDISGVMIEQTGTKTDYIDDKGRSPTWAWGKQGSWEKHEVGNMNYKFYTTVRYAKTSMRCVKY